MPSVRRFGLESTLSIPAGRGDTAPASGSRSMERSTVSVVSRTQFSCFSPFIAWLPSISERGLSAIGAPIGTDDSSGHQNYPPHPEQSGDLGATTDDLTSRLILPDEGLVHPDSILIMLDREFPEDVLCRASYALDCLPSDLARSDGSSRIPVANHTRGQVSQDGTACSDDCATPDRHTGADEDIVGKPNLI